MKFRAQFLILLFSLLTLGSCATSTVSNMGHSKSNYVIENQIRASNEYIYVGFKQISSEDKSIKNNSFEKTKWLKIPTSELQWQKADNGTYHPANNILQFDCKLTNTVDDYLYSQDVDTSYRNFHEIDFTSFNGENVKIHAYNISGEKSLLLLRNVEDEANFIDYKIPDAECREFNKLAIIPMTVMMPVAIVVDIATLPFQAVVIWYVSLTAGAVH